MSPQATTATATTTQPMAPVQMVVSKGSEKEQSEHGHRTLASRLRGAGGGKDCLLAMFGCFLCCECCEGCCDLIGDIICCPCEMLC